MDVGLDENVDATDAVEWDLDVLVVAPVSHFGHVGAAGRVLFVACVRKTSVTLLQCVRKPEDEMIRHTLCEHNILIQSSRQLQGLIALLPTIVVEAALNVLAALVTMEPHIRHQDIAIVGHEVLQDGLGTVLDVDVPPIDPRVLGLQCGGQ